MEKDQINRGGAELRVEKRGKMGMGRRERMRIGEIGTRKVVGVKTKVKRGG